MKTALAIPLVVLIFIFGDLFNKKNVVLDQVDETFSGISMVDVNGSFLNVVVIGIKSETTKLTGEITSNKDRDDLKIEYKENGGKLTIWVERPSTLYNVSGKIKLEVPENTILEVTNASGSISAQKLSGEFVRLKSSSGSIKAADIFAPLAIDASSGSVSISNIEGDVEAETSSGSIAYDNISGTLRSESSSGSQKIRSVTGNVNVRASSGSLSISNINGNLVARTNSGSIKLSDIKGALTITTSSGSQTGNNITLTDNSDFKSSSGSITMDITNSQTDLRFMLRSTSGSLKAFDTRGKKNLKSFSGRILVNGVSHSGSQSYF